MTNQPFSSRILFLRSILNAFTTIAALWIVYIFTAGFFSGPEEPESTSYKFDLTILNDNNATYFKIKQRELLVIHSQKKFMIFWAQDPVYGCRLEFSEMKIKPVCIDIEYDVNGQGIRHDQQLKLPDYEINSDNILTVY